MKERDKVCGCFGEGVRREQTRQDYGYQLAFSFLDEHLESRRDLREEDCFGQQYLFDDLYV